MLKFEDNSNTIKDIDKIDQKTDIKASDKLKFYQPKIKSLSKGVYQGKIYTPKADKIIKIKYESYTPKKDKEEHTDIKKVIEKLDGVKDRPLIVEDNVEPLKLGIHSLEDIRDNSRTKSNFEAFYDKYLESRVIRGKKNVKDASDVKEGFTKSVKNKFLKDIAKPTTKIPKVKPVKIIDPSKISNEKLFSKLDDKYNEKLKTISEVPLPKEYEDKPIKQLLKSKKTDYAEILSKQIPTKPIKQKGYETPTKNNTSEFKLMLEKSKDRLEKSKE